jgi:hypothetical protein
MPQHQHGPHHKDKNPKHHEKWKKGFAGNLAAHPPKTVERGHKYIDECNERESDALIYWKQQIATKIVVRLC